MIDEKLSILDTTTIDEDLEAIMDAAEAKLQAIVDDPKLTEAERKSALAQGIEEMTQAMEAVFDTFCTACCDEALETIAEECESHGS